MQGGYPQQIPNAWGGRGGWAELLQVCLTVASNSNNRSIFSPRTLLSALRSAICLFMSGPELIGPLGLPGLTGFQFIPDPGLTGLEFIPDPGLTGLELFLDFIGCVD